MTCVERRQEEGLVSLFAAYISKRVDTYSSLLQAVGHVFTWFLMNLQLAAPPMPYLRRFLKWCEKTHGPGSPLPQAAERLGAAACPGHTPTLDRTERGDYFRDQDFNRAAYFVNLLLALLAGVTYGFRTTELCPGQTLLPVRQAVRPKPTQWSTICATSLYWERSTFAAFVEAASTGTPSASHRCGAKPRARRNRERQERLNQAIPFVRQDSNPINFPANYHPPAREVRPHSGDAAGRRHRHTSIPQYAQNHRRRGARAGPSHLPERTGRGSRDLLSQRRPTRWSSAMQQCACAPQ